VLPSRTQIRGFKPGRSRQDFQGEKILSTPSFGGEVNPLVPCYRFVACKRTLNVTWISAFRQNYRPTFSPTVPPFATRISRVVWTWRHLAAKVGTSKTGSHNKPTGCSESGAYASGPDDDDDDDTCSVVQDKLNRTSFKGSG
jgi:hypothetical protein